MWQSQGVAFDGVVRKILSEMLTFEQNQKKDGVGDTSICFGKESSGRVKCSNCAQTLK